jgi:hypothetical protein
MEPFSIGLAVAGATALVNAMVTDGWEGVRKKIAALFGRGDQKQTEAVQGRLDQSQAELAKLSGDELAKAQQQLANKWQTRFQDLLDDHPDAEQDLRAILNEIGAGGIGGAAVIQQNTQAHDQAKVAVQAQGVMHVNFGDNKPQG